MQRVAITGMGVVSPIGNDVASFERALFAGDHGIVPIEHFDTSAMSVRVHAPVKGLQVEDHFSALEARRLDPYCVFGMIAAREAARDAGLYELPDPDRTIVYMSSGLAGVGTLLSEHDVLRDKGPRRVSPMLVPKWVGNMLSGLVSIDLGARGASMAHVVACASGSVSIGEAMRAIRHGYADVAVCGGAEAGSQQLTMAGFQNLRALSTSDDVDRASIPFDRERSGFVLGEGGAAIILESESHARARGARIHAVLSGYAATSDAHHVTAPAEDGTAVSKAIVMAMDEAGERGGRVHVNAHGTGTAKNDRLETEVVGRVLSDRALVSSTKSMTGHLLGAAGAVEAVAAVLAIKRRLVPPTVGARDLDPGVTVDVVRGAAREAEFDRALSLNLGFGGHNVCLVFDRMES